MDGVVLEVALRHARALREQQLERLVELVVRELLAHGWPEERRTPARRTANVGGELEACQRTARAARVALAVREEGGRRGKVRAEGVVL